MKQAPGGKIGQPDQEIAAQATPLTKDIARLVETVRAGNQQAYADIVKLYQERVFGLAFMVVRDRTGAEDIAQEAFYRAYTQLHRYDAQRDFYPWLATITVNLARNWHRTNRPHQSLDEEEMNVIEDNTDTNEQIRQLINDEAGRELWQMVGSLPQSERTAVLLYYRQELKIDEVATTLGVTDGTIKTLLFRARKKLRDLFAEQDNSSF